MKDLIVIGILITWAAMISILTFKRSRTRSDNNDSDEFYEG
jgi:hypothetical protein